MPSLTRQQKLILRKKNGRTEARPIPETPTEAAPAKAAPAETEVSPDTLPPEELEEVLEWEADGDE